ncbi:hypothetical protein Bbelb_045550 [Branchiostoma belcheri]|nr:hypothetical protein Bbelb_045550 [Branchiostoma belcheri]
MAVESVLLLLAVLASAPSATKGQICPDGYSYNAGLCYQWTDTLADAADASADCAADGATLAFPRSADEHDYLVSLVSETVLIGITDVLHEGTWKYADGTPIGAFNQFLPEADHPNTDPTDCVVMSKDDGYMWKPSSCSQQYGYVCQTDADMTQVPQIVCPAGYIGIDGTKCYKVVTTVDSAITALAECHAEGADAVLPTSDLEHYYVKSLTQGTHWIGVTDATPYSTEGNWVYITTGTPALGSFNRWGSIANDANLNCVTMDSSEAFQWAPTDCLEDHFCVCQKDPPDQCPPLVAPENGAVSGSSLPGGLATFSCDVGYNMNGAATTTCQADLTWSNTNTPTCDLCPGGYSYNAGLCYRWTDTLTYAMDAHGACAADGATLAFPRSADEHDYLVSLVSETVLIGITDVLHEGTWKYADGTPIGAFSKFLPEADHPNTATVDCVVMSKDDGYMWKPSSCSLQYGYVCQTDADMSLVPEIECPAGYIGVIGTKCYKVVTTVDSAITALGECHNEGADAVLPTSDLEHYYIKSLTQGTHWIGVTDAAPYSTEGNWVYLTTGTPALGSFNRWGSTANTEELDCVTMDSTEAFQWTPTNCLDDHSCVCQKDPPDQCPALLAPENGAVSGSSLPGGLATFSCDVGYNMNGAATTTCQADLTWTDTNTPTCHIAQCPPLSAPPNGALSPVSSPYVYQDEVEFSCDTGYNLVGLSTITCQATGYWSGAIPTCNIVQCPLVTVTLPVILSSGSPPYSYQDVVSFSCAEGYDMDGAASVTCQASGTWSDVVPTCNDIDACLANPCDAQATCTDNPAPALDATCACNAGYEGDGLASGGTGCTDIDACVANPCDAQATCTDNPAPALDATCACNAGYEGDGLASGGTGCTDIDACLTNPCDAQATCTDNPAPALDATCACNAGYEGDGLASGGTGCSDIDACLANPCDAQATCTDNPAPALDATCACNAGYEGDGLASGGTGCSDIDACVANPCDAQATCTDNPAPALDATCACNAGYEGDGLASGGTGCSDIDACVANPCDAQATCTDNPAPALDATCACNAGYEGDGLASGGTGCSDIDACLANPCDAQATCTDNPAPALDATCACNAGYEGDGLASGGTGCSDIDACVANPCDAQATCTDNPAPALDATCACNAGYEGDGLASGGTGCSDIDACLANPCDAQATCTDNPAPALDATCACNAGYEGDGLASGGTGCSDIDACLANPCDAQATCTDNPAPALDATCACNAGYEGDGLASGGTGCSLVSPDPCVPNPCRYGGTCRERTPSGYTCQCRSGYTGNNCQIGCKLKHPNFPVDQFAIYDNRCYWFSRYSDKAKYTSAASFCSSRGGRLPTVKSATKQSQLEGGIAKFGRNRNFWIGLDDRRREKVFKWSDGTTLGSYTNWRKVPSRHKYAPRLNDCVREWPLLLKTR